MRITEATVEMIGNMKFLKELLTEMDDDEWSAREDEMMQDDMARKHADRRSRVMKDAGLNAYTVHVDLMDDKAYQYSRDNKDVRNMRMVLRAHKLDYSPEVAEIMVNFRPEQKHIDSMRSKRGMR
jgi:hypothetical protein